jgi:methionyl-tRNA formyltransferase
MKIIFFGSGEFTMPLVKRLYHEFALQGVVFTKPRPKGRGMRSDLPEIGQWAQQEGIKLFMPVDPHDQGFINSLIKLKPSLFVLSSYGYILKRELLDVPDLGSLNIHPSLLPKYRGAAPIQRCIMAGEQKTGITVFFMDEKIDHGEMILQKAIDINPDDNYGSLRDRLALLGADMIVEAVRSIEHGTHKKIPQNNEAMSYASKIGKKEMLIDWRDKTSNIVNLIRALSPKPGAESVFRNRKIKILSAVPGHDACAPGKVHVEKKKLVVGTSDGSITLEKVKPQDRNVISGIDFKNGFHVKEGEVFG